MSSFLSWRMGRGKKKACCFLNQKLKKKSKIVHISKGNSVCKYKANTIIEGKIKGSFWKETLVIKKGTRIRRGWREVRFVNKYL